MVYMIHRQLLSGGSSSCCNGFAVSSCRLKVVFRFLFDIHGGWLELDGIYASICFPTLDEILLYEL